MLNYIFVGFGAAIGGVLRYWLANYTYKFFPESLPIGTLVVNVVGSFILGLIMFYFSDKEIIGPQLRIFLTVGFCGGCTTFSTCSYETMSLFNGSQILLGLANIMVNLFLCLSGIYLAYFISKLLG